MIIQVKWSDEDVWKDLSHVDSLEAAKQSWEETKDRCNLKYDAEFRIKPDETIDY